MTILQEGSGFEGLTYSWHYASLGWGILVLLGIMIILLWFAVEPRQLYRDAQAGKLEWSWADAFLALLGAYFIIVNLLSAYIYISMPMYIDRIWFAPVKVGMWVLLLALYVACKRLIFFAHRFSRKEWIVRSITSLFAVLIAVVIWAWQVWVFRDLIDPK